MKTRFLLSIAVLLCYVPVVRAQNIEGQIIAAQYGKWRIEGIPQPPAGNGFDFVAAVCAQIAGNATFQAFQVGTPIEIFDADPSLNETVTPSAVSSTNQACTITVAPAHVHHSFSVGSATAGLQEALNANLSNTSVNTIVLTQAWYDRGGSTGIIASVHGSTTLNLVDVTKAPYDWYAWNGTIYAKIPIGGANLPTQQTLVGAKGDGNGVQMPEKGITVAGTTGSVAWDEDYNAGRFDCRNPKYAGGCLGSTPQAAMQAFSDALVCYQSMTGLHARTQFPPGTIAVGTAANPTLKLPAGAIITGGGGWGFGTDATQFQATYNNHAAFEVVPNLTSSGNCSDGSPHTSTIGGGSLDGVSEHGCSQGGCANVPGDSGNYPFGGPLQIGISDTDPDSTIGKHAGVYANDNGGDGVLCNPQDGHCYEVGGAANNAYFYYGMDQAGQNYQFNSGEFHGEVVLGGLDAMNEGPFETYGTFMTPGWEYGHIAGIVWSGGLTNLGHYFSQIEEIGVIHATGGNDQASADSGRIDAPRGDGILEVGNGQTTWINPRVISACRFNGAADYLVYSVATTTPGSGQTPGTYLLTGSDGHSQISVTVASDGTVTANPIVTVHSRGMTSTPPTYTLAAGGTPATFTATMFNIFQLLHTGGGFSTFAACDYVNEASAGNDTWVSPGLYNNGFFGASYATGDIFSVTSQTWITPHGNNGGDGVIWDPGLVTAGYSRAREQKIISADKNEASGGLPASGATIDLSYGSHIQMANGSPVTLTNITNGTIMSDLWITGDGFTTMPEITSSGGFGAANCFNHDLLLQAGQLYHYLLTSGVIFAQPAVYTEQCDSIDQTHWWVNHFAAAGALPALEQQGQIDSMGDIRSHAIPALAALTGQSGGTPGANGVGGTYTYAYRVWGTWGTQTWGALSFSQCLPLPGYVNNPCFQNLIWTIPEGTTHVQLYRETSTDGVATAGMIFEQTWTAPQKATPQSFEDTRVAPINGNTIGSANYGANMTGGPWECGTLPPVSAYPAVQGQRCESPATGFCYWASADDHWKKETCSYADF